MLTSSRPLLMRLNVLVLSAVQEHTGNFTTAKRISDDLQGDDIKSTLVDIDRFDSSLEFAKYVTSTAADCVVAIHAYRSGRLLLECPVSYCIVFGGTDLNEYQKDNGKLVVMTKAVKLAKFLVGFSESMRDQALLLWPEIGNKLYIQPQGVLTSPSSRFDFKEHLHITCGIPKDSSIFLLVAGLRSVKDPLYLVDRFSEWHSETGTVYLVIMGPCLDSEFSEKVKAKIESLSGVHVVDPLPVADCHKAMVDSTAVVNSSMSEGMSNAILEAMDLGVPVIARNIPGNRTLITHRETGLLYDTPEVFVILAKGVLDSPEQHSAISRQAKEFIDAHHLAETERNMYVGLVKTMGTEVGSKSKVDS